MNITELLVTAYDGDTPVFAIDLDPDLVTTVLTATDETGVVEAAQRSVVAADERAARVLEAIRELVSGLRSTSMQARIRRVCDGGEPGERASGAGLARAASVRENQGHDR